MNKTWKTILKVISYVIAAILGAAGEATMMYLCGAAHREQYRARDLSGGRNRRCGCRAALLCGAVVPAGRLHLRARPVHPNH